MSDDSLEDFSLIDLFRSEVETHSEVLSAALLSLERSPEDTSRIDEMMRAAHSIKGAARVVGIDAVVSLSHVMEDCFNAAQKGTLTLRPADVDVLLRSVDLLGKISEATRESTTDLAHEFDKTVKTLVVELGAMLVPRPAVVAAAEVRAEVSLGARLTPTIPSASTIRFPELLDTTAAEAIRRELIAALECGCDALRLDLRATKDLSVQGLALLALIPRHLASHVGPRLQLSGVSPEMEIVLGVTGLGESYGLRPLSTRKDA